MKFLLEPIRQALKDPLLKAILLAALLLSLSFNASILLGRGPDEQRHMNYVRLLLEERRLPLIESLSPYREYREAHAFHPPLYHLSLVPAYALLSAAGEALKWHLLRFLSSWYCLASLPLIYSLGLRAGRGDRRVALLAAGTVALLPMFSMTASTINNDAAALFFTVLFLYVLTVPQESGISARRALALGVVLGLGGLSKATVLLCDAAALLAYLVWTRGRLQPGTAALRAVTVLGVGALLVGPWHLRSWNLYGRWNPLPPASPWFSPPLSPLLVLAHPDFPRLFAISNWGMFYTLWGQRDWFLQVDPRTLIHPPPLQPFQLGLYLLLLALCLAAAAGLWRGRRGDDRDASVTWPAFAAFAASWLAVLAVALFMHQGWAEGGRYMLPAFAGLALPLALGWRGLLGRHLMWFGAGWLLLLLALNILSLYWLHAYLIPTYGPR